MMTMLAMMRKNDDDDDDDGGGGGDENDYHDYDYENDDDDHPLPFHSLSLFGKPSVSVVHKNLLMTPISHLKTYKELLQGAHVLV